MTERCAFEVGIVGRNICESLPVDGWAVNALARPERVTLSLIQ